MLSRSLRSKLRSTRRRLSSLTSRSTIQDIGFSGTLSAGHHVVESSFNLCNYVSQRWKSKFAYPEGMTDYENDWVDEPQYPPIDPETHKWNEHRRERLQNVLDFRTKIRNATCPETKNLEWNMPRQYGYKTFWVTEDCFEYDSLKAFKFVTRTHIASNSELPSQYASPELNEKVEYFKNKIKEPLLDALLFELDMKRSFEEDFNLFPHSADLKKSRTIIPQINRVILSVLGKELDYLKDCQVDLNPNVQAFWHVGGQEPTVRQRNRRKGWAEAKGRNKARYVKPDDPCEENIQYIGKALLQVRCRDPPRNYLDPSDPLCQRSVEEFPDRFPHFLKTYGFKFPDDYRFASFIPGHWSGDENKCNLIAYHPRDHLVNPQRTKSKYWSSKEEVEESLFSQAILVSFGRLLSQAFYHGFDQFTDLDYPFSTQTVITNGLEWSFFAYQLNTMKFDQLSIAKNPKQNVIWGTQSQSIFDKENKGELNDQVISNLLRFYLNQPHPIKVENPIPTPYLGRRIQDWEDDHERTLFFWNFRSMVAQHVYVLDALLRHRPPEIYEYEKIYKLYFKAMPLDKKLKHFEFPHGFPGYDPYNMPYKLVDPTYQSKGVRRLLAEVAAKKEKEAMEAAKLAEAIKYGVTPDNTNSRRRK